MIFTLSKMYSAHVLLCFTIIMQKHTHTQKQQQKTYVILQGIVYFSPIMLQFMSSNIRHTISLFVTSP